MLFRELNFGPASAAQTEERQDLVEVLTSAIRGADAYAAVRRAVKNEENVLRIGNRFVRRSKVKEVAFLAVGHCAAAMARAFHDALGELVTQGLVGGPEPPPDPWPFLFRKVTDPMLPSPAGVAFCAEALELAGGLGEHDLFVPLISPGALGMLASPPPGLALGDFRELLGEVARSPEAATDLPRVAAALSMTQGGRLGAAARTTRVEALLVERGDGGRALGAGPTVPPDPRTPVAAREVLERRRLFNGLPAALRETLTPDAAISSFDVARIHNVVVAGPADALDTAGAEAAERKHRPSLVNLHDTSSPELAAASLLRAMDQKAPKASRQEGSGIALFSGLSLGVPEGGETREVVGRFLKAARDGISHREVSVALMSTVGSIRPEATPSGGIVDARTPFATEAFRPAAPGALDLRPGFTDVGAIAVAFWTQPPAPAPRKK